jgi:hypothetical protein
VKRFSIAHELGHHRMQTLHSQGRRVETDANAFAGELLVPGPKLFEALRSTLESWPVCSRSRSRWSRSLPVSTGRERNSPRVAP